MKCDDGVVIKQSNIYFTADHEKCIIDYINSTNHEYRSALYEQEIAPVFSEMVDKIVYTFKFNSLPNSEALREDCKVWLSTVIDKYDCSKGYKAFSYFSIITKNWFIHQTKERKKNVVNEISLDDAAKVIDNGNLSVQNAYFETRQKEDFFRYLYNGLFDSWTTGSLKSNEYKVGEAIKLLFSSSQDIEIFNKKAVYLYFREITGLSTKQIVNGLSRLRSDYSEFRHFYNNDFKTEQTSVLDEFKQDFSGSFVVVPLKTEEHF